MSDVNVWDSTIELDSYQVEKRYSQLKIPLLFGYDVISRNKFVFGLKAGVEMYFFLDSHNISRSEYDAGLNQLVSVNPQPENFTGNNFWLIADLSAAYYISRRLILEFEPQIKYDFDQNNSGSTQSNQKIVPSLRTSLKLKF